MVGAGNVGGDFDAAEPTALTTGGAVFVPDGDALGLADCLRPASAAPESPAGCALSGVAALGDPALAGLV